MEQYEHGGNIHKISRDLKDERKLIDFSANINPLGPPEWVRPLLSRNIENLIHYPDPDNTDFVNAISSQSGINPEEIVVANGTTELLYTIMRVVECSRVVVPVPSYVDYLQAAEQGGKDIVTIPLREQDDFNVNIEEIISTAQPGDLVVLATPNNPTGNSVDRNELLKLMSTLGETLFLVDEAFLDFLPEAQSVGGTTPNVITLNSMTKFYGVPGLRVGYGTLPKDLARKVREYIPPWSVNSLAQVFAADALKDHGYQEATRRECVLLREDLATKLAKIPYLKVFSSRANYLFIKLLKGTSKSLYKYCLENGILIRKCDNYLGLENPSVFFRVAVRNSSENKRLVQMLEGFFHTGTRSIAAKNRSDKKGRSIMFQGTCSDAGKSILTAGLCRVLFQDGIHVAPFKAQNMSLNSFVTLQGDEMGRAQVVQAQGAKIIPDCRMNPVLLKPNSDTGSQVIVNGKPVGNMSVTEYNGYKSVAWDAVCKSYDSLANEYDAVVLEGAGSPGEVNLKKDDIVNMRMAQYAQAPVLLIGDIDRGGVYASFVGILEVLSEWERDLVAGFVVNKFRGQGALLQKAHEYVESHTGKRVLGVLPFLSNLGLPEEDSVSFKKGLFNTPKKNDGIEIALINLPHISNFTDVEPFLDEPDVSIKVIDNPRQLGSPQAIILPGSKNVIHDLGFLKDSGFVEALTPYIESGTDVVGICGGYQMLGNSIQDPYEIESSLGQVKGLGLLAMDTVIEKEKNLTRKEGIHRPSGKNVFGYEIHHGISSEGKSSLLVFSDDSECGTANTSGKVWGSYLHGIFDSDEFRRWYIDRLRVAGGLDPKERILAPYNLEDAFDRLADSIREHIDLKEIYRLLDL